jgi:hypothetical protein
MIAKERPPTLGWWIPSLSHVLGHAGLSDLDAELEEFTMDQRRSHRGLAMLISRISLRISGATIGRPPRRRDFHRQYDPNPARCHLMTVSGFTIEGVQHLRSQAIQANEHQTVQHPECRPLQRFPPQNVKLMTQNRVSPQGRPATGTLRPTPTTRIRHRPIRYQLPARLSFRQGHPKLRTRIAARSFSILTPKVYTSSTMSPISMFMMG